jgi:hypothetical protein
MLLGDNDKINKHIDLCLNGEMIRTTIKEDEQQQQTVSQKRPTPSKSTPSAKRQRKKVQITPQRINGIDNYFYRTDSK